MPGSPKFAVRVSKDYTVFAAAHFVTYDGDQVEPLHGHNYRATVSLEGPLDDNHYVFNFVPLKRLMREVCDQLDHRMLLPTGNPLLEITADTEAYTVRHRHRRYVFPREDVVQLPIPNTTAEQLAEWISHELEGRLRARGARGLRAIVVEVAETFGQSASCRRELAL